MNWTNIREAKFSREETEKDKKKNSGYLWISVLQVMIRWILLETRKRNKME